MTREELIQSKEYWLAKLQIELFNEVERYMKDFNLSRSQFATQLGVSKGYISQILNGDADHRLSKLVELSLAIGLAPSISYESLTDIIAREENGCFGFSKCEIDASKKMLLNLGYMLNEPSFGKQKNSIIENKNSWTSVISTNNHNEILTAV